MVPSSANNAIIMLWNGRAMTKPTSSNTPMPMNTRQAIKPLLNMNVYTGCSQSICRMFMVASVPWTSGSRNKVPILSASRNMTPALTAAIPIPMGIISSASRMPFLPR